MAKGSSQSPKTPNPDSRKSKSAWKGIQIKPKSPSRPDSVSSQDSRHSSRTVGSLNGSQLSPALVREQDNTANQNDDSDKSNSNNNSNDNDNDKANPPPAKSYTTKEVAQQNKDSDPVGSDSGTTPRAGRSRASSAAGLDSASEIFEDALNDQDEEYASYDEDEIDQKPSMSMILPALQNAHNEDDDDDNDDHHAKHNDDDDEYHEADDETFHRPVRQQQRKKATRLLNGRTSKDLTAEIEALEIGTEPEDPIPATAPAPVDIPPTKEDKAPKKDILPDSPTLPVEDDGHHQAVAPIPEKATAPINDDVRPPAELDVQQQVQQPDGCANESPADIATRGGAERLEEETASFIVLDEPPSEYQAQGAYERKPVVDQPEQQHDGESHEPAAKADNADEIVDEPKENQVEELAQEEPSRIIDVINSLNETNSEADRAIPATAMGDAPKKADFTDALADVSLRKNNHTDDEESLRDPSTPDRSSSSTIYQDRLATLLPAMESSIRDNIAGSHINAKPPTGEHPSQVPSRDNNVQEIYPVDNDMDLFRDNTITIDTVDLKNIAPNVMGPREQEEADEPIREGMAYLFDNKFMKAKKIFNTKAKSDPMYALGLGSMAFIKAMMTLTESDVKMALDALTTAYAIAKAQIEATAAKRSFMETISHYFASFRTDPSTGLPVTPPAVPNSASNLPVDPSNFSPNGVLRAHVVQAECCLLMAILQITQESVLGYLRCGLNLRRAYSSYMIAWQEYKRMGQGYAKFVDRDTVSGIQFGIGAVHLLLSSLPQKILRIFSMLGWKSDKHLGFALLKLCLEGKGVRAPLASLTLLSYYTALTSFAPQLYAKELSTPAVECLMEAQKSHPASCFFLYFAARIARAAGNVPLSIQSFSFAVDSSRGEWAEVAMRHMAQYETGWNHALQLDWESAAACFEALEKDGYWSPAFSMYFVGCCREMLGMRTEAILAFAEVPQLVKAREAEKTYIDVYVQRKVELFQRSGYQDMDLMLPAYELLLVWNVFEQMEVEVLLVCLDNVDTTLNAIQEREKMEYDIRLREIVPNSSPPDYYDQRAVLLLTKASVLNALGRHKEAIPFLNWIMDHKEVIKSDTWTVPFAYWEGGITSWHLGNCVKSRKLWQQALSCTKYDFEYRMAVRLNLALSKCDEMGVAIVDSKKKPAKVSTLQGRATTALPVRAGST